MANIANLFASIPGLKLDFKHDWKEDAKADWNYDWDLIPGSGPSTIPANTVLPLVTGTTTVGQTLSVTTGTWTGSPTPTYTYQWKVNGVNVAGATSATYVLQAADASFNATCVVTAHSAAGTASATAVAVGPINAAPVNTALPLITGTAQTGQTLSVSNGTWTGFPTPTYTYQWRSNSVVIGGATSATYIVQASDQTFNVDCIVTAHNSVGNVPATAAAVGPVIP